MKKLSSTLFAFALAASLSAVTHVYAQDDDNQIPPNPPVTDTDDGEDIPADIPANTPEGPTPTPAEIANIPSATNPITGMDEDDEATAAASAQEDEVPPSDDGDIDADLNANVDKLPKGEDGAPLIQAVPTDAEKRDIPSATKPIKVDDPDKAPLGPITTVEEADGTDADSDGGHAEDGANADQAGTPAGDGGSEAEGAPAVDAGGDDSSSNDGASSGGQPDALPGGDTPSEGSADGAAGAPVDHTSGGDSSSSEANSGGDGPAGDGSHIDGEADGGTPSAGDSTDASGSVPSVDGPKDTTGDTSPTGDSETGSQKDGEADGSEADGTAGSSDASVDGAGDAGAVSTDGDGHVDTGSPSDGEATGGDHSDATSDTGASTVDTGDGSVSAGDTSTVTSGDGASVDPGKDSTPATDGTSDDTGSAASSDDSVGGAGDAGAVSTDGDGHVDAGSTSDGGATGVDTSAGSDVDDSSVEPGEVVPDTDDAKKSDWIVADVIVRVKDGKAFKRGQTITEDDLVVTVVYHDANGLQDDKTEVLKDYAILDQMSTSNPSNKLLETETHSITIDGKTYVFDAEFEFDQEKAGAFFEKTKDGVEVEKNLVETFKGNDAVFGSKSSLSDFKALFVDDLTVDSSNYTVVEGSTIVTLKKSFVDTLSLGEHAIRMVFNTTFTDGKLIVKDPVVDSKKVASSVVKKETSTWNPMSNYIGEVNGATFNSVTGQYEALDGFAWNDEKQMFVQTSAVVSKGHMPSTADESNMMMYVTLFIASMGVAVCIRFRKEEFE